MQKHNIRVLPSLRESFESRNAERLEFGLAVSDLQNGGRSEDKRAGSGSFKSKKQCIAQNSNYSSRKTRTATDHANGFQCFLK